MRGAVAVLCALVVVACGLDGPPPASTPGTPAGPPLVGFTFSPKGLPPGADPAAALRALLLRLHPDLVRLPVYWDEASPDPDTVDLTQADRLVQAVADYDAGGPRRSTRVILVAGARNVVTPELHLPDWASDDASLQQLIASHPYHRYLFLTFKRYARNPLLYAWQVENEPLDSTNVALGDISIPAESVRQEIDLLRRIDPMHAIVVTTYSSSHVNLDRAATSRFGWLYELLYGSPAGHPVDALALGDALGLDVYVVTPSTPLDQASAVERIGWKAQALCFWSAQAERSGKELWVTEMQAAPWNGTDGFGIEDLRASALAYRDSGASVILLWGVETWLAQPEWMTAGRCALAVLRSPTGSDAGSTPGC